MLVQQYILPQFKSTTLYVYNNNNNNQDDAYGAVVMAQSHCERSAGSLDECRLQNAANPQTKPASLGLWVRRYRQQLSTSTIATYYFSTRRLIFILPPYFFDSPCTYYKTAIDQGPKSDRPHHAHTRWTPPLKQKSQLPHNDCATRLVRRKKCCTNVRKSLRKKHICLRRYGSIKS